MASGRKRREPERSASPRPQPHGPRRSAGTLHLGADQSARILLIGATGLIIVLAVAMVAFGYWYSEVRPRGRTVLEVEGVKTSFAAMQRRMRYELADQTFYETNPEGLPQAAYEALVRETTLIVRGQTDLDLTLKPDEIEIRMRVRLGIGPDQPGVPQKLRAELERFGINDSELRRILEAQAYQDEARNKFIAEAPATAMQAKVELISAADEQVARTAAERVRAGEDWAAVARELSTDPSVQTDAGVKDYQPQAGFNVAIGNYAFTAEVGAISDPLRDAAGAYHIVRVTDRADRPLTEAQKGTVSGQAFTEWLARMQASVVILDKWTEDLEAQDDALRPIVEDLIELQQQQRQLQPASRARPLYPAAAAT